MHFKTTVLSLLAGTLIAAAPASADERAAPENSISHQFYVRGDLGFGWYDVGEFMQPELARNGGSFISNSVDDTVIISAGIGVQANSYIRIDLTGEYRTRARLDARDNLTARIIAPDGTLQANTDYTGKLESIVGLVNGYIDLFTVNGITPYIGGGIGLAHNTLTRITTHSKATFTDLLGGQISQESQGYAESTSKTEFAWALMAGASFDISPDMKLDVSYRYLNLGSGLSAETGPLICLCGSIGGAMNVNDLESHDIRIGLRIALSSTPRLSSPTPLK